MNAYPVDAPQRSYQWRGRRIAYYTAGPEQAPATLLVHSINAAASAFEMRYPFAGLRNERRVYTFDLLGFGGSERPAQAYTAADYAALIADFARDVVGPGAELVASSLGAAYSVRAAARHQELFKRILLICPTGIRDLADPQPPGTAYALLYGPVGDLLFAGLRSRPSIAYFLKAQSYYDPKVVDQQLIEGFYTAAQAPGAKYAPICFLTGLLSCNIADDIRAIQVPILIAWGRNTTITPLQHANDFLERNRLARLEVFERARLSLQDEHPEQFLQVARAFFAE